MSKSDRTHDGSVKHHMATDAMVADLAKTLEHGNDVLREARLRRIDTLIGRGHLADDGLSVLTSR